MNDKHGYREHSPSKNSLNCIFFFFFSFKRRSVLTPKNVLFICTISINFNQKDYFTTIQIYCIDEQFCVNGIFICGFVYDLIERWIRFYLLYLYTELKRKTYIKKHHFTIKIDWKRKKNSKKKRYSRFYVIFFVLTKRKASEKHLISLFSISDNNKIFSVQLKRTYLHTFRFSLLVVAHIIFFTRVSICS